MTSVLLDTHAWAWSIHATERLSPRAARAMEEADQTWVSPVSFYEIAQKARLGKWPEMLAILDRLDGILADQGGQSAPLTGAICRDAGHLNWDHRDPFDRMITATAQALGVPVITADRALSAAPGLKTIW